jgi:hypothetical protein
MSVATDPPAKAMSHGHARPFLLANFNIKAECRELSRTENLMLLSIHPRLRTMHSLGAGLLEKVASVQIVNEGIAQRFRFQPNISVKHRTRVVYLVGYWQVYNIAEAISEELRQEFSLRTPPTGKNLEAIAHIQDSEQPVSVHLRRGDYTMQAEGNVALTPDYYLRAMTYMREHLARPRFYVFSDDIKFAREHFGQRVDTNYLDHNDAHTAHEDLRLMSTCRHHIIANSTFSWWAAWLNQNREKIVIAPRRWMVGNHSRYDDLLPPGWLKID